MCSLRSRNTWQCTVSIIPGGIQGDKVQKLSYYCGGELILPAVLDMVNILVEKSVEKLISKVPLSNNTISRRIHGIAEDLNYQLIEKNEREGFWFAT